ncbi:MAG: hypothetical protein NVSMB65_09640 [Chloroflexota bacterium]
MTTGNTPPPQDQGQRDAADWAQQLARRRKRGQAVSTPARAADQWVPEAIAALTEMFDTAVSQANAGFEHGSLEDRITRDGPAIMAVGPAGERQLSLFVSLRSVHGHGSGGATIATSVTSAVIYLVPRLINGVPHWVVLPTGTEFTLDSVQHLFLAVFGDDPEATSRISPWFSMSGS